MKKKTRQIEMYVGLFFGDDPRRRRWYTTFVNIPRGTPKNKIAAVAESNLVVALRKNPPKRDDVAFTGVYDIPPIDSVFRFGQRYG